MLFCWLLWHRKRFTPVLSFGRFAVHLLPNEVIHMDFSHNVGDAPLPLSIKFLDQHGNTMTTTPAPDAPPTWSNDTPISEMLTVAPDGLSATDSPLAAGTDTVTLTLHVGGVAFTAVAHGTVNPEPQVLSSIEIVPGLAPIVG